MDSGIGTRKKRLLFKRHWRIFVFLTPGILCYLFFAYLPMIGIVAAFQKYNPFGGYFKSPFVGLYWFKEIIGNPDFKQVVLYTITMSTAKIAVGFMPPIFLALLLNELSHRRFKRVVQTVSYLPHFLSWVIVSVIVYRVLDVNDGILNNLLAALNMDRILFMGESRYFITITILSDIWKEVGWGTIFYLAALTSIDIALYDAAAVDGAGRFKQFLHITMPGIMPTAIILLTLCIGGIVNANFDQVFNLQNPLILSDTEVINTYIYRKAMLNGQYSFSAAFGLAQGIVSFLLVYAANKISKKTTSIGIY